MRGGLSRFRLASASARRHRLLAGNQLTQALLGRRKIAFDHDVGGARQAAAVTVGVCRPRPDDLEREQARVDRAQELLVIEVFEADSL